VGESLESGSGTNVERWARVIEIGTTGWNFRRRRSPEHDDEIHTRTHGLRLMFVERKRRWKNLCRSTDSPQWGGGVMVQ